MVKKRLGRSLFTIGQQVLLRRMFRRLLVRQVNIELPVLIIVNHSSFYDSLVLFELLRKKLLPANTIAVMNANGRANFPFFKHLGTIPVSTPMKLSEYKEMQQTMKTNSLLIFPQGEEQALVQQTFQLQKGSANLWNKEMRHHLLFVTIYYTVDASVRGSILVDQHLLLAQEIPKPMSNEFLSEQMYARLQSVQQHLQQNDLNRYTNVWSF